MASLLNALITTEVKDAIRQEVRKAREEIALKKLFEIKLAPNWMVTIY